MKIIANQLIFNVSKKLWKLIKSYTGKSFQSIADGPVELANETIGNSRCADKWENLISSDCDYYPECDSTIVWSDITDALADTPKKKAPGADGVPSEVWKLVTAEPSPISPLDKLILKIINLIELANETIGNSRCADKWENLISSDCDYYPECDSTIVWSDITDALADTPKKKAPGADGVPSEIN
ncbi:hypothetical protein AYI69_g3937 [Smittium culicis]|uniref:Uncharacterized protein n=1 Tax=Smittium culicis TaxID=133412 RepID=A0A1R1YIE5_9FUNG|nr:hypothetical protein AYI69_g3937 [Smittium culicis]